MRHPVQMRRRTRVFSGVSTEDSDIPSSCEMKNEPAFKPLQGNLTLFLFRQSQYPLHLTQQTHGPSHIPIAEGRLLLRCLWKDGLPIQKNPGLSSLLEMIWDAWSVPRVPVLKLVSYTLETCVSGNLSSCLKKVKPLVVYDGEQGIALEQLQGNRA